MLTRGLAAALSVVLIIAAASVPVFAGDGAEATKPTDQPAAPKKSEPKLKAGMQKLLSDARAGKVAPKPQQFPNTKRNNLSTGAKIGIAAGIGAAIFLIIMFRALNSDDD
jgi:hypothetical protein